MPFLYLCPKDWAGIGEWATGTWCMGISVECQMSQKDGWNFEFSKDDTCSVLGGALLTICQ